MDETYTKGRPFLLCLRTSLALVAAHKNFRQIRLKNLASWICKVVSGMLGGGGWNGGQRLQYKMVVGHK